MKVLVIGGGGREYAICQRLKKDNPELDLYCLPGNDAMDFVTCVSQIKADEISKIVDFAVTSDIDYCVVTPDDPLALGLVDRLNEQGIACFGPAQAAAQLESSKAFAKEFMQKYQIPTAAYQSFTNEEEAVAYCADHRYPLVIKADGLALGKGVEIVQDFPAAKAVLEDFMLHAKHGKSSQRVVIEEYLEGPEISVLSFCDSKTILPLTSSMDHKRAYAGDLGPNTGGMGVIAPNPIYTAEIAEEFNQKILQPTLQGLQAENLDFRGCLYFGLMLTKDGLKVIEYNARFGDPETQAVLPLLQNNLFEVFQATTEQRLADLRLNFQGDHVCCVVLACEGYPVQPLKNNVIQYSEEIKEHLIFAGVKKEQQNLLSAGGRVLNVLGFGKTLEKAIEQAYANVKKVHFEHSYYRDDIGQKALQLGG